MFSWLRQKFGPVVIVVIMGLIIVGFVLQDYSSSLSMRTGGEGSIAGKVNGETIPYRDFARAYDQRVEFFKSMTGGKLTEAQVQAFRIREGVFSELVNRKLKAQEAERAGTSASDHELRERIQEMDAFHKDGKFDVGQYRQILAQNGYSEARFEQAIREDLSVQQWGEYFRSRVRVSEDELKQEFLTTRDKRDIKYVLLTPQEIGPATVPEADARKYIADAANQTALKGRYEARKETVYKGMTQAQAELQIARELIAESKPEDARKAASALADQIVRLLAADAASDARVNAILKPYKTQVKSTGLISQMSRFIPGIGEAGELMKDAFGAKSPIDPRDGGRAKKYDSPSWLLVAVVARSEKPNLAQLDSERDKLMAQISFKKQREIEDAWMKKIRERAKVVPNSAVVGGQESGAAGAKDAES